jgi:hypothetical protein
MKRSLPWVVVALCGLLALGSAVALIASFQVRAQSQSALLSQMKLYSAREHVAQAQEALGDADIKDALTGAREANTAAERVAVVTRRIVRLLRPMTRTADVIATSARTGLRGARFARRQTEVAAQLLGAIAEYQNAASAYSDGTTEALGRILNALRRTNGSFPLGALPELP